jgi:DNA-directed RNA polymerase beta subunit
MGVIEWLDCKEAVNSAYCAHSYEDLCLKKNDELNPFTHCELLASFYGIACGTQPFSQHNTDSRTAFQSKVVKQACAVPTYEKNPIYKEFYRQSINDKQLTKTLITDFLTPYGKMIRLAVMSYRGHNQEDAIILNERLMDRGCFFVLKEDLISVKIEPNESICMPDIELTEDIKTYNYGKLKDGIVMKGSIINYGDVLVSKRVANKKNSKGKKFLDRSFTFHEKHPQIVLNWSKVSDDTGTFIRIHIREERRLRVGDKMSSTHGQKGVVSKIYPDELMPFSAEGVTPDLIMGPHGFPTRKTTGQNIEGEHSKLNALLGVLTDHTVFTKTDLDGITKNLLEFNYKADKEILYDGITGQRLQALIVLVPCYYQRLSKFVHDSNYAIAGANKSVFTRQAVSGHKRRGGLRFGEMENFAAITTGAINVLKELNTTNSDAFTTYICRCGSRVTVVNEANKIYSCKLCNDPYIVAHHDSFTSNMIINQLITIGMQVKTYI